MLLESRVAGRWTTPEDEGQPLHDASTGEPVARVSTAPVAAAEALAHARDVGGPALRALQPSQRAALLKDLVGVLTAAREELGVLSAMTGATPSDTAVDVDGGIATTAVYASKGRRELGATSPLLDGEVERLSRGGTFVGRHLLSPLHGAVLQVNAFNFPVWGMLEKLAPALLAGVPSVVKPAPQTAYVTAAAVRAVLDAGVLPEGALQLLVGGTDGLLEPLTAQDVLAFTGSAATAAVLRGDRAVTHRGVRFTAEADSLNACVLGPDAGPGSPERELFLAEVVRETLSKAGQKCTAIRRALVPRAALEEIAEALQARFAEAVVGDPRDPGTTVGALVDLAQRDAVREQVARLAAGARLLGDPQAVPAGLERGAFLRPLLVVSEDPRHAASHALEAFGPVVSLLPYDHPDEIVPLLALGAGSLVATLVSTDLELVTRVVRESAAWHGRLHVLDRTSAAESTGHGAPLPHLVHGGPGRAGGGQELGGVRAVHAHLQRTALQGSPDVLTAVTGVLAPGATRRTSEVHPFRRSMAELEVGDSVTTGSRTVTREDVDHFAAFTGDTFYAHTDEQAAAANPLFGGIVAHGYLVLSLAAGLFVDPAPGPVLANTGLDRLRFTKPVKPGDSIHVVLTCMQKTPRTPEQGEVRWDVQVLDQDDVTVATYELLTMVAAR